MEKRKLLTKIPMNRELKRATDEEIKYYSELEKYFEVGVGSLVDKLSNFTKFVPRQDLAKFLAKYEMFKKVLNIHGSIIECGVLLRGGLMTFAQLSAILEPVNHQRKIIGFDTFSGFPTISNSDEKSTSEFAHEGGLAINAYDDLKECIKLYDSNRFLNHISKVELIKGDINTTVPQYLEQNPHTIISLLYLDADVYEPTKVALKNFLPRMSKGSIIAFDELNAKSFVGETLAAIESLGINKIKLERFPFEPGKCYAVLS